MSKSLAGLRSEWIAFGWFICAALTALVLFVLIALGVVGDGTTGEDVWVAAALAVGFWAGGVYVGTRVAASPILHGVAIGLFSVIVWFLANFFLGEPVDQTSWRQMDGFALTGFLVIQAVAAIVGARIGVRWIRRGR